MKRDPTEPHLVGQLVSYQGCRISPAQTHSHHRTCLAGAAASAAEAIKVSKYSDVHITHQFLPVATETGGVWGQGALGLGD